MSDYGWHPIDEYLSEEWIEAWAQEVVCAIEAYLGKHAAFDAFLGDDDSAIAEA